MAAQAEIATITPGSTGRIIVPKGGHSSRVAVVINRLGGYVGDVSLQIIFSTGGVQVSSSTSLVLTNPDTTFNLSFDDDDCPTTVQTASFRVNGDNNTQSDPTARNVLGVEPLLANYRLPMAPPDALGASFDAINSAVRWRRVRPLPEVRRVRIGQLWPR